MSITILTSEQKKQLQTTLDNYPKVHDIVQSIAHANGRALLVGGAPRDLLLGLPIKDLDIEVHGLELEKLENILGNFGIVNHVGKSFGVLRLEYIDIDWSLPRTDSSGRKPQVIIDPNMSLRDAFRRRDLTINAIGIDLITFELLDPFNGIEDLKDKILRAPDARLFSEDPLRFYRVMQFIGRFEMQPDAELDALCNSMNIEHVSRERIEVEFSKLFLKSKQPSLGIRWLYAIKRLKDVLPEVADLVGVAQEPQWHSEGDVFEHTMQALDAAAALHYENEFTKLCIMYAALCHDLGKPETTKKVDGKIISHEHAQVGYVLTKKLLKRITHNIDLINTVSLLVLHHMEPVQFVTGNAKPPAYKRLARKLAPYATLQMLADLSLADRSGRNPESHKPLTIQDPDIQLFLKNAQNLNVRINIEEPLLHGRDFADVVAPGPEMGELVKLAYEIQIEHGIQDKDELKRRTLEEKNKKSL